MLASDTESICLYRRQSSANYYFFIKLALQHAHIKLRIMTYACTIKLCMLEGMLASSASTLKDYNVH